MTYSLFKTIGFVFIRRLGLYTWFRRKADAFRMARRILVARRRHQIVLARIRHKDRNTPIRVLFLNNDTAKWKCQSVYDLMNASCDFEPFVGITALGERCGLPDNELEDVLRTAARFFDERGVKHMQVVSLHPRHYDDLRGLRADLVFFPEPWGMQGDQTTEKISRFALPCYVPYFIDSQGDIGKHCLMDAHRFLYAYFAQSNGQIQCFKPYLSMFNHTYRLIASGHPALDFYSSPTMLQQKLRKNYVIYAPHHSVKSQTRANSNALFWSTFLVTGPLILAYAQSHPEFNWFFKPHPRLRTALLETGKWTTAQIDTYYKAWSEIGEVCYDGDYQKYFLDSKVMITDCNSFLTEYGASGKPVIHLVCEKNSSMYHPDDLRQMIDTFYRVQTPDEMFAAFRMVLEEGKDPNQEARRAAVLKANLLGIKAAQNIVDYLRKELRR